MKTALLLTAVLAVPAPAALSQVLATSRPAVGARDAGTFHVATNTWTRRVQQSTQNLIGPDVLYDNTCTTGYFSPLVGDTYVDEGRLPSPSAPAPTGCATSYRIDGFTFGYCTDQTSATFGTYTHRFYQAHTPCASITNVSPTATIALNALPAGPALGTNTCWTVTIDLAGSGGGSFVMAADGNGGHQGSFQDRFGWAMSSSAAGSNTGPMIAGDPVVCAAGAGTVFSGAPGQGTGLGNLDQFRIQDGGTPAGCYWFGGTPFSGFDLTLRGTACETFPAQVNYCAGDGASTACPCGNNSAAGANVGCLNTSNVGGKLRAFGTPSVANDSFVLLGSDMTNETVLYFQGTTQANGGAGFQFGDGLRCVLGTNTRLGTKHNAAGASNFPSSGDGKISVIGNITAPGTRMYQAWYRNSAPFCTAAGFNLTNGVEVAWGA